MAEQMAPQGAPAEGQPGPDQVAEQLMGVKQFMQTLLQTAKDLPKGAGEALSASMEAYDGFLQAMGMGGGDDAAMGPQSPDVAGKRGAVPAEQPMGRNVKAVPA